MKIRPVLAAAALTLLALPAMAQEKKAKANPTYTEPPELTTVTGTLVRPDKSKANGGIAFFVFQNRLNEIPHENPLEKVAAMAEKVVPVGAEGQISIAMAPGNYALVYDPAGDADNPPGPGAESMAVGQGKGRERFEARIAAIRENAEKGLPIENGKLGEAFVVENRFVRPPAVDFGEIVLQSDDLVEITANGGNGQPIDFPAALRLRGKNGDVYEPHTPSVSQKGIYTFVDVLPQSYQVFALGTRPRPGAGDEVTTPTVTNESFIFDGSPIKHTVTLEPGKPGDADNDAPPPAPPAGR